MPTLPSDIIPADLRAVLAAFAPLFSVRTFAHAQTLLVGTILTPGRRTVAAALRAMGLAQERHFQNYHRVLSRDQWSSRLASRTLLRLLVQTFAPAGTLVMGIDETLERGRGDRIAVKGIYRDADRSSKSFFVKSSGLRWVSLMLLCPIPWAGRVWALPFLTVLAPSEHYHQERGRRSGGGDTRWSRTGRGRCCSRCAAGCPSEPWSWSPTPGTPCWTCYTGADV